MPLLRLRLEGEEQVTFIELFFDVVFVFAVTELSGVLVKDLSLFGAVRTAVLFFVVWWAWIYTTWMTNWFNPDLVLVRTVLLVGMLASMLMAIAIPDAFGDNALLFASGYVGLQVFRNSFIVISTDDDEPLHSSFVRILVWSLWVGAIWIAGALVPDDLRFTVWALALLADYAGPLLGFWTPTLGRTEVGEWEIDPAHFAERCHLFVIICLGESIVRTGVTAAGLELTAARLGAVFVAFLVTTILWWLYFDEVAQRSTKDLHEADEH